MIRRRILTTALAIAGSAMLSSCSLLDSVSEAFNVFSVKFSEASPAVDGQTITYSGGLLDRPSLDKFHFKMVFHVKADNSANTNKAAFGSSLVKPVLNFRISSKSNEPISATIEPFSVNGGETKNIDFPVEIPITVIDRAMIRNIISGNPIPYFLSGTVKFDLLEGTSIKGSGTSELDLTSGEIETRPPGTVTTLLSGLL
ncbi:MAG: hypothetical protein RL173_2031 [Fibrobacterota bacterium]|jgi:hypothetical protein